MSPGRQVRLVAADLDHRSRNFEAEDVRCAGRWRVAAAPLEDVRPVDARGLDADEDFARSRLRLRTLDRHENVRFTRFPNLNREHGHHRMQLKSWTVQERALRRPGPDRG